ncbi:MAG TPA: hypothetical protein DC034_01885 [Clostridium sp.]|uniref:Uncharacterized protein n=1 Tax=Clostridium lapidicellarium TaxID=3240931 RepID=A0ABV4DY75_9CLOT|nr:hypothetical protein [uncultured Clostridium sp.]NLU07954.1 hypothetical protein [Clostridiales bacterium]HBC95528.1 hypothetical protein [Clostridium sp.]
MANVYPWIFNIDNDLWKIYLNDTGTLVYKLMEDQGKWTKEKSIDMEVVEFAVCIEDDRIHIIYVNKKYEMRYCTMKNGKWFGKLLYYIDSSQFKIEELKAVILKGKLNFFYLLKVSDGSKRGILKHYIWDGKEIRFYTIQNIVLSDKIKKYYEVEVKDYDCIYVFFLSDSGDEISLSYCEYENGLWTSDRRLYGLQGDNVLFKAVSSSNIFNIINKTKEGSVYLLEHVCVESDIYMKKYEIYKSNMEPIEPIIFYKDNDLFACWQENNDLFCSSYSFGKWSRKVLFSKKPENTVRVYNFIDIGKSRYPYKVYGIEENGLLIFSPSDLAENNINLLEKHYNKKLNIDEENESIEEIKEKFKNICRENIVLKEKIDSFSMYLQKKKYAADEYKDKFSKIVQQKRRLEENLNFFMEVKKNIEKQMNEVKEQFSSQQIITENVQNRLEEKEKNNKLLKEKVDYLLEENEKLKNQLEIRKSQSLITKLFKKRE